MRIFIWALLALSTTTYADNHSSSQEPAGVVEKISKSVSDNANRLVNDVKEDGTNFNYVVKISEIEVSNGFLSSNENLTSPPDSTLFGTFGVRLLPNTWKIDIALSLELDKNVLFGPEDVWVFPPDYGQYVIDEGETSVIWYDVYLKPISSKYGDVGFGYKYSEQNNIIHVLSNYSLLNRPNASQTGALALSQSDFTRDVSEFETIYFTYNIPSTNSWYDGFGVSVGFEKSDIVAEFENLGGFVIHPDNTTTILSVGIKKPLEEVKPGFGFKTLRYGNVSTEHKFYNWNTMSDETVDIDGYFIEYELIYMFKPGKSRQFYISAGRLERIMDSGDRDEFKFELGLIF